MPLNINLEVGFKTHVVATPKDASGNTITLGSAASWTANNTLVTLAPTGPQNTECWIISGANIGTSVVTVTDGSVSDTVTVNFVPVPFDHFVLTNDSTQPE